jgi:hypothetical protein
MTPPHFYIFVIISPLKRTCRPFIWTNLNSLHPRVSCIEFDWFWPAGSGDFSVYFYSFAIISPWRRVIPFFWTNLNPLYPKIICAKSGCIWSSGFGEEVENVKVYGRTDRQLDNRRSKNKVYNSFVTRSNTSMLESIIQRFWMKQNMTVVFPCLHRIWFPHNAIHLWFW